MTERGCGSPTVISARTRSEDNEAALYVARGALHLDGLGDRKLPGRANVDVAMERADALRGEHRRRNAQQSPNPCSDELVHGLSLPQV